jgi:5-methylcytosine-specific restriction enzyme subunit McrC
MVGIFLEPKMPLLYEYGRWENISNKDVLKRMLQDIWQRSLFIDPETVNNEEEQDNRYQPFLKFDGSQIRANNFVGFIQNEEELIEIYPKVFKSVPDADLRKELMLRHIFYWFSYCRKWRFPFNQASLDTFDTKEFPELIINLIANQTLEVISQQPLTTYQQCEEALQTPRGSINFGRYVSNSISRGHFHSIECDFEPFLFDNKANRIIKYCSRLLLNRTKFYENQRILQEIIFILDEVEDVNCTIQDVEKVSINTFFESYAIVMDSCRLILNQQLYSSNTYNLSQWCLLFPMEYIFEDFFAGFLERHFKQRWKIEYQKSDLYLSNNPKAFKMQHDIFLTSKELTNRKIIVDTKYKLRESNFKSDPKKGVSQTDLYQMVSYAFKRGCTDIVLVYPNLSENLNPSDKFEIISGFEGQERINVLAMEIPFWSINDFKGIDEKLYKAVEQDLK